MKFAYPGMSPEDKKGIVLFTIGVLILLSLLAVTIRVVNSPEKDYDRVTLCNENLPRSAHHLLIVDVSDALSAHQVHFLRRHISDLLEASEVNDRFSIFVLDEKYNGLSDPVIDLCKPRSVGEVDPLTSNRLFVERLYRERFEIPLDDAIASVVSAGDQKTSPIYEALSDIVSLNRIDSRAREVYLAIVSDMIQNSGVGSVFSSGAEAIDKLPMIDLHRARTTVFWLDREKYSQYQTADLASSWEDYLASVSRFEQIERVRN